MNVLFVNDWTSNPNWGDRGAAYSLALMVQEQGGTISRSISEDALYRGSLDENGADSGCSTEKGAARVARLLAPPGLVALGRKTLARGGETRESRVIPRRWEDYRAACERVLGAKTPWPNLIRSIPGIDIAVIHGDGAIYGDNRVGHTMLFLGYLIKTAFGKPVVLVNHSADFDRPGLLEIAKKVYPLLDDVVFRDVISFERCSVPCTGRFAADTAFALSPAPRDLWVPVASRPTYFDVWPDTATFDPSQPYVCVGGSSIFGHHGEKETVISGYRALLSHLQSVYTGQLVLTASDVVDETVLRPLARELRLPLVALTTPVQQAVDILGNADAYIGGRWHPAIFALSGGAPLIALSSKTPKMNALAKMAGLSEATFDALDIKQQTEAIGVRLLCYLQQSAELRTRLRSWAVDMAAGSRGNAAYLGTLQAAPEQRGTEGRSA
jgi:hypothetical protein